MDDVQLADSASTAGLLSTLSRMGERVAKLEAGYDNLKEDTGVIRGSVHNINQELQKITIVEEGCRQSLNHLTNQVGRLVDAAPAIAAAIATFEGMRTDLREVIQERQRTDGQRNHTQQWAEIASRALPWLIALAGLALWGWQHIKVSP